MKLPWGKDKTSVATVKGRAAVVPRSYKFQVMRNMTENNLTVNSYSTVVATVKVLQPGETAESTAEWAPGTLNYGAERFSVEELESQGLYRVQFDAPNWVGVIISQDGTEYVAHVELPVWIDPSTGRVVEVDVPELVHQLEPKREQLSKIWGLEQGPFADFHQILQLPKTVLKTGKFFASLPGEWVGAVKDLVTDLKEESKAPEPLSPETMPDLTQYEPVEGIDFDTWVKLRVRPKDAAKLGTTFEKYMIANPVWTERTKNDEKLFALFENEIKRVNRGG